MIKKIKDKKIIVLGWKFFSLILLINLLTACEKFKRDDPSPVGIFYPNRPIRGVNATKVGFLKSHKTISFSKPAEIKAVGKMTWNSLMGDYNETAIISVKLDNLPGDNWGNGTEGDYYATISWLQNNGRIEYTGSKTSGDYFWNKGGFGYILKIIFILIFLIYLTSGIKKIPIGCKGITLWFGAKSSSIHNEGFTWHLPIFSTIEVIDCKVRFIEERIMEVSLAHFISIRIKTSVSYRISNPSYYLDNYSISDLEGKVKTYVNDSLRRYFTKNEVTEKEIIKMNDSDYKTEQVKLLNQSHLQKFGIEITDVVVTIIEISKEMLMFFEILRQADILHENVSYHEALKKALLLNNKIGQTNINLTIQGLTQLKRLTALS